MIIGAAGVSAGVLAASSSCVGGLVLMRLAAGEVVELVMAAAVGGGVVSLSAIVEWSREYGGGIRDGIALEG